MKNVLIILGQLTDLDADWLAGAGRKVRFGAGDVLVTEGRALDSVFIVLDGDLVALSGTGRELGRIGTGEIVGEMSFVDAAPPSATVKAVNTVTVLQVPRVALQGRLDADPPFAARFYRALAILLSDRLRSVSAAAGGATGALAKDELDLNVLDAVSAAGDRFGRILKRLSAGR